MHFIKLLHIPLLLFLLITSLSSFAADHQGKIIINPVTGFSDTTVADHVGGNYKDTIGAQRLEVFERAAFLWSSLLDLDYDIEVSASFSDLACESGSATLGYAGPERIARISDVWYPTAQANQINKSDTSDEFVDIYAEFNANIDNGCYDGAPDGWYYGLDNNEPDNQEALLDVVMHEIGHGLGFLTFVSNGELYSGSIDSYTRFLKDSGTGKSWADMTDAERLTSSTADSLVWSGSEGNALAASATNGLISGELKLHAPASFSSGSSVSHISTDASPDQLMEPYNTDDGVSPSYELGMLKDMGYKLKEDLVANSAPVANSYTATISVNTTLDLDLIGNSTDADGDGIHFFSFTKLPFSGTLSSLFSPTATYTPPLNFTGTRTLKWKVYDDNFQMSNEATLTINVINAAPLAVDDAITIQEDADATVIHILANDVDDEDAIDESSVWLIGSTANLEQRSSNPDGSVTIKPVANFHGDITFDYVVSDDANNESEAGTVTITVESVNDAPVTEAATYFATSNQSNSLLVLDNSSDVDHTLTYSNVIVVSGPSNGDIAQDASAFVYTPDSNFVGTDSFTYKISDGELDSATVTATIVVSGNTAPVASDYAFAIDEDSPTYSFDVSVTVVDDSGLDLSTIELLSHDGDSLVWVSSQRINIHTKDDFNGEEQFTFRVRDDEGMWSNSATVTVTINPVDDIAVTEDDSLSVNEDSGYSLLDIIDNDNDIDSAIGLYTPVVTTGPLHGSVNVIGTQLMYQSDENFFGTDTLEYHLTSDAGDSNTSTVTINVRSVNDRPIAVADALSVEVDTDTILPVLLNDTDVETANENLEIYIAVQPHQGYLTIVDGQLNYDSGRSFRGLTTFSYSVKDEEGLYSSRVESTIQVGNEYAPLAKADFFPVYEDTNGVRLDVVANDTLFTDLANIIIDEQPENGLITFVDGTLSFDPLPDAIGSSYFTYRLEDIAGAFSYPMTSHIYIMDVNDAPTAHDFTATVSSVDPTRINFQLNIADEFPKFSSIEIVTPPANGVIEFVEGSTSLRLSGYKYSLTTLNAQTDFFEYRVVDAQGEASNVARVDLTVGVPEVSAPANDTFYVPQDQAAQLMVMDNDFVSGINVYVYPNPDSEFDSSLIGLDTSGRNHVPVYRSTGNRDDIVFDYVLRSSDGSLSEPAVVTVKIINEDSPVVFDDYYEVDEGVTTRLGIFDNDLSYTFIYSDVISDNTKGTISIIGDDLEYTPADDDSEYDEVHYSVKGYSGEYAAGKVIIKINREESRTNDESSDDNTQVVNVPASSGGGSLHWLLLVGGMLLLVGRKSKKGNSCE